MKFEIIDDGREPIWDIEKFDVALVGTTIFSEMRHGFQVNVGVKYPSVAKKNDEQRFGDMSRLGTRLTFYDTKPIISLLYICDYAPPFGNAVGVTLDYDALRKCLETANAEFKGKSVITTVLGSALMDGRGDKEKCLQIMRECLTDVDVTVYDYPQKSAHEMELAKMKYLSQLKRTDKEEYKRIKDNFDEYLNQNYIKPLTINEDEEQPTRG